MLFTAPPLDERELQVLDEIEVLKNTLRLQLREPRRWKGSLRRISFARNIQGSNSIEGYIANLDDAAAVAVGEEPLDSDSETRLALSGYRDAMTYVLQLSHDEDFVYSEQLIKSLHFMMTSYSIFNRPGLWRLGSIYVKREGDGAIVYEGPDVAMVPKLMRELITVMNSELDTPPIISAAMAHLNLVMIHPFKDGNGRAARCLQSLALGRTGVLFPEFMSIEEYLGRNTQSYYDVLGEVGQGAWHPENDARPWLRFTLTAHLTQAQTLLTRVRESERLWHELESLIAKKALPERTILALYDACFGMRIRNSVYRANLLQSTEEEISDQVAGSDLRKLVGAGLLTTVGEKRGRFYRADGDLREIMLRIQAERPDQKRLVPFTS